MNKKTVRILTALFTILLITIVLSASAFAASFAPNSIQPDENIDTTDMQTFGGKVLGALQAIGVVAAVLILAILGIKYMVGSAEEKADYKKSMIPYLIGAVVLFLAPTIANAVYNFVK